MKKRKSKTLFALLICLDLLVVLTVGGTLAYLFTTSGEVENTFTPPNPEIHIDEPGWNGVKKENVTVQVKDTNNAGVKSYIRADIVVTWREVEKGEDKVFSILPTAEGDYKMELNLEDKKQDTTNVRGKWIQGADDFYYFTEPVEPGGATDVLIILAEQLQEAPPGYFLHIEVLSQAIQAEPTQAAIDSWGVTINGTTITGLKAATQSE